MIKKKEEIRPMIDLTGPDGNACYLLGTAKNLAKQLGIESEPILKEMMSGYYENLIEVFDKHFGEYIDLVR